MNMFIAQVHDGALQIVESVGVVDPDEQVVDGLQVVTA